MPGNWPPPLAPLAALEKTTIKGLSEHCCSAREAESQRLARTMTLAESRPGPRAAPEH